MREIRIATVADGREIAYRVASGSEGPVVLYTPQGTAPVELLDEDPMYVRFAETIGSRARLVYFDRPGIGASDPFDRTRDYESQVVEAFVAVLDALEATSAWMVGSDGHLAAGLIRLHRPRVLGAVLLNPMDPFRSPVSSSDEILERGGDFFSRVIAPSRAGDPVFLSWSERVGRLGATAAGARAFWNAVGASRRAAGLVEPVEAAPPVRIVRRRNALDAAHSEWWRRVFPDAELVTLEGRDLADVSLDAGVVAAAITEFVTGERVRAPVDRRLVAVLFTDLVDSTRAAAAAGDAAWRALLDSYERQLARAIERHHGDLVKHTGDGALATFPSGSQAIDAAVELRNIATDLGLRGRAGVHVGEVELRAGDIGGIAVHLAARVMGEAGPGEILASSTAAQSSLGGRYRFAVRGTRQLKGISEPWQIFEVGLHT